MSMTSLKAFLSKKNLQFLGLPTQGGKVHQRVPLHRASGGLAQPAHVLHEGDHQVKWQGNRLTSP